MYHHGLPVATTFPSHRSVRFRFISRDRSVGVHTLLLPSSSAPKTSTFSYSMGLMTVIDVWERLGHIGCHDGKVPTIARHAGNHRASTRHEMQ